MTPKPEEWRAVLDRLARLEQRDRTVTGGKFVLTDAAGNALAVLGVGSTGPALALYGTNGRVQAAMTASAEGPMITCCDAEGRVRLRLGVHGSATEATLYDMNGKPRAVLAVYAEGEFHGGPRLVLSDADGQERARLGAMPGGASGLTFTDANGKIRAAFDVSDEDSPTLSLHGEDQQPQAVLTLEPTGGVLGLLDCNGRPIVRVP